MPTHGPPHTIRLPQYTEEAIRALSVHRGVSVGRLLADFAAQSMNQGCPTCGRPWLEAQNAEITTVATESVPAGLIAEAKASVALDGDTRSEIEPEIVPERPKPSLLTPPRHEPACDHRKSVLIAGGMRKCPDCKQIRDSKGVWRSV